MLARGKQAWLLLHPTCSAEKRCGFPGLVRLGKKGLNPDASREKSGNPLRRRGSTEKGCCGQPRPHQEPLQPPASRCRGTDRPGRVSLPGSSRSPSLTGKSGRIQAGTGALAGREPGGGGPHLSGRTGSRSSHGCGLGAGWAGLGPRGQNLHERARATGKGAAWHRNGWRREKRLLLSRRGFSSPPPCSVPCSLPTGSSLTLGPPAFHPQLLLALEPRRTLLPSWDEISPGLHGQEKQLSGPHGSGDMAAKLSRGPQRLNLSGAEELVIILVTAPKLALESQRCFGFIRRKWA